jgi:hypothetical protein
MVSDENRRARDHSRIPYQQELSRIIDKPRSASVGNQRLRGSADRLQVEVKGVWLRCVSGLGRATYPHGPRYLYIESLLDVVIRQRQPERRIKLTELQRIGSVQRRRRVAQLVDEGLQLCATDPSRHSLAGRRHRPVADWSQSHSAAVRIVVPSDAAPIGVTCSQATLDVMGVLGVATAVADVPFDQVRRLLTADRCARILGVDGSTAAVVSVDADPATRTLRMHGQFWYRGDYTFDPHPAGTAITYRITNISGYPDRIIGLWQRAVLKRQQQDVQTFAAALTGRLN